ncbi:hypothetical protein SAMN05428988_0132 [Chitinophaga sp. YR573]|uniref:hypothetical protein n=1 Tax=Chitinophaga sp. YR573 TaxID=1881040 RepID=UPI0008D8BCD9|nr:hypothetical protein [Chitinophaga sp. YR573]SEV88678.1 hypothetical protein SAMN05428988_0132 [Chitinophaga sp. YR573]
MTKKQLKALSGLYSAILISNALGNDAYSEHLKGWDVAVLADLLKKRASSIAESFGEKGINAMNIGDLDSMVIYCKENF